MVPEGTHLRGGKVVTDLIGMEWWGHSNVGPGAI